MVMNMIPAVERFSVAMSIRTNPVTHSTHLVPIFEAPFSSLDVERTNAAKPISPIFANSDGWKEILPISSHLAPPLILLVKSTMISKRIEMANTSNEPNLNQLHDICVMSQAKTIPIPKKAL
jgi:hypothetical protein